MMEYWNKGMARSGSRLNFGAEGVRVLTWVVMAFLMLTGAIMQTMLPASVLLGQAKFPFLLAIVLYYALSRETGVMIVAGLMAGFLHDALSQIPFGYSEFCFCAVGWIASRFRKLVMTESVVTQIFFGGFAGIGVTLGLYALLARGHLVNCSAGWVAIKTLGTGILGMICTPLVFSLAWWLDRVVGNVRVGENIDGLE